MKKSELVKLKEPITLLETKKADILTELPRALQYAKLINYLEKEIIFNLFKPEPVSMQKLMNYYQSSSETELEGFDKVTKVQLVFILRILLASKGYALITSRRGKDSFYSAVNIENARGSFSYFLI